MNFTVTNSDQLVEVAAALIQQLDYSNVMAFHGPMGAGKTTLIKAICRRMGVTDEVNSPTFSIVNEYITQQGAAVYHFDFYRINKLEEVYDIGYENYFYSPFPCFIEWPEKMEELLPEKYVYVSMQVKPGTETRIITCELKK